MGNGGKEVRVTICGAGISGLSLAVFLSKSKGFTIEILESATELRLNGTGIAIWPRYWELLRDELDFEKSFVDMGYSAPQWSNVKGPTVRKSDAPKAGIEFCALTHGPFVIPRSTMSSILLAKVDESRCCTRMGMRLTHYDETAHGFRLHFADGSTSTCDVLVGADGVFSRMRQTMYKNEPDMALHRFSGQVAYRMVCPAGALRSSQPEHIALQGFKIWSGCGRHVTSNILGDEIHLTAWDNFERGSDDILNRKVSEVPTQAIVSKFEHWEPDLVSLLENARPTASRWPINVTAALPSYVSGNAALIGDAAHGMTPHQGLGAGQGIEDAYFLAKLLSSAETIKAPMTTAMLVYDRVRRPQSQLVAKQSLANGRTFAFLEPSMDGTNLAGVGRALVRSCDWLEEGHGCVKECAQAIEFLKECFGCGKKLCC